MEHMEENEGNNQNQGEWFIIYGNGLDSILRKFINFIQEDVDTIYSDRKTWRKRKYKHKSTNFVSFFINVLIKNYKGWQQKYPSGIKMARPFSKEKFQRIFRKIARVRYGAKKRKRYHCVVVWPY